MVGKKRVWHYCDGDCGTVLGGGEARAGGCGICRCTGHMRYLEMTDEEYDKYRGLLEKIGVIAFTKSLPVQRPLHNRKGLITAWEKEMGI